MKWTTALWLIVVWAGLSAPLHAAAQGTAPAGTTAGGAVALGLGTVAIGGMAAGVVSGAFLGQSGNFVNLWVNGRTS